MFPKRHNQKPGPIAGTKMCPLLLRDGFDSGQQCVKISPHDFFLHRFHNVWGICRAFKAHSKDIGVHICLHHSALLYNAHIVYINDCHIQQLIFSSVSQSSFARKVSRMRIRVNTEGHCQFWSAALGDAGFYGQFRTGSSPVPELSINLAARFHTRRKAMHVSKMLRPERGLRLP